jgi:multisubunit Na+/H+ antiporter MnhG subunit
MQENIEPRIRTMRTLWIAMLMSVGFYYAFTFFVKRPENVEPNSTLFLVLAAIALSTAFISFPIKNKLISRATEQQHVPLVQQAYILAWALSEVPALLGLLDFFLTGNRYFYVLFLIAVFAQLLHFPRREHVINASFKKPIY